MPLDSLLSLVEKLRERIDEHRDDLSKNETLTRDTLINPLLKELGWDNPELVMPEFRVGRERVDYALLSDGKPIMVIEAKSLGTPLEEARAKAFRYRQKTKARYFSVTDGQRWEIQDYKPVSGGEKKTVQIVEFDLKDGVAAEVCVKALTLWRLVVDSDHASAGQDPVVGPAPDRSGPSGGVEWQPISELKPQLGSHPVEVQFPDNLVVQVTTWKTLLEHIARWLIDRNYITKSQCPIPGKPKGTGRYAVSTEPAHLSGIRFRSSVQVGSLYVEVGGGRNWSVIAARTIIKHVGQNPAEFKVRFS